MFANSMHWTRPSWISARALMKPAQTLRNGTGPLSNGTNNFARAHVIPGSRLPNERAASESLHRTMERNRFRDSTSAGCSLCLRTLVYRGLRSDHQYGPADDPRFRWLSTRVVSSEVSGSGRI